MIERICQCCGRTERLPQDERDSPTWGGAWSFPPIHALTTCPRCPSSHLITGDPCDHEWTEERYDEATRIMAEKHSWVTDIIEEAASKGMSVEELKGAVEKMILSKEKKQ